MFSQIFERFDQEMLLRRIEREFKHYSVKNTLGMCTYAFNISNISADKGDVKSDSFEPYDYDEESTEPKAAARDNLGRDLRLNKPE